MDPPDCAIRSSTPRLSNPFETGLPISATHGERSTLMGSPIALTSGSVHRQTDMGSLRFSTFWTQKRPSPGSPIYLNSDPRPSPSPPPTSLTRRIQNPKPQSSNTKLGLNPPVRAHHAETHRCDCLLPFLPDRKPVPPPAQQPMGSRFLVLPWRHSWGGPQVQTPTPFSAQ